MQSLQQTKSKLPGDYGSLLDEVLKLGILEAFFIQAVAEEEAKLLNVDASPEVSDVVLANQVRELRVRIGILAECKDTFSVSAGTKLAVFNPEEI